MKPARCVLVALAVVLLAAPRLLAQNPSVTKQTDPPPTDLADPVEALLSTSGQHVTVGPKTLDFWWVKSLPLRAGTTDVAWSSVEEGTLVGAVKLPAGYTDVRGKTIKPGIYTLRLGIQPSDGNHLGVSANREFLLISPMAVDDNTAATSHDKTIDMAKQTIGASHPAGWNVDPLTTSAAPGSIQTNDAGQKAVVFEVPVSRDGKDVGLLRFGLVLIGTVQT